MPSSNYPAAKQFYADFGVDTEIAIQKLTGTALSLHCWQGDDVGGFEGGSGISGGGIAVTGNYPGRARTLDELRKDLEVVLSLLPGKHRIALHASYGDFGGKKTERNEVNASHFQSWIDWAKKNCSGLDFNGTFFSHPLANDGWTLSSANESTRKYWIEHAIASRKIGTEMGKQLGTPCVTNVWIPDGCKEVPVDRDGPRQRLAASLDTIFKEKIDPKIHVDAVEPKLFGIGSESYVVGSHEFYLGYAAKNQTAYCLDAGHFHPTEVIADKISSLFMYVPYLLTHVSRGVRWDSDHVVLLDDQTRGIMEALVRGDHLGKTFLGLDYFDASLNRVAAYVIGARSAQKALLFALLEPITKLRKFENEGDYASRLALLEESKVMPVGEVWNEFCRRQNVPGGFEWLDTVKAYETKVQSKRS